MCEGGAQPQVATVKNDILSENLQRHQSLPLGTVSGYGSSTKVGTVASAHRVSLDLRTATGLSNMATIQAGDVA
ncbi:hypothetical protein GCM10022225_82490 [Plantactinospora mayteni]|uniref:Uncharacterized protein n=1 Tax=Plantactinospora mayteni TaxID=566021 RepID=A0ABQ4F433_9ACTN|nr:hypothetical protein Pma05_82380 [Plantactinospora mayteni]